jgi:hypothetical protein
MQMGSVLLVRILSLSGMYVHFYFNVGLGSKANSRPYSTPPTELLSFSVREVVKFDIIISFPGQE